MLPRYRSRMQLALTMVVGLFLLANLFAVLLIARTPALPSARGPVLLTILVVTLLVSLLCLVLLLRWLLRPYRQLVGEAERAPVAARSGKARDEAEFVLETFQSVVG